MVDKDMIKTALKKDFYIEGDFDIDHTGVVNVNGNVTLMHKKARLPVQFGTVTQDFNILNSGLKTLKGCPRTVGGMFVCRSNPITSFAGGPAVVKAEVYARGCKLTSLEYAPQAQQLWVQDNPLQSLKGLPDNLETVGVTWSPHLAMLSLLTVKIIRMFMNNEYSHQQQNQCLIILRKYQGTTNPADILRCASELNEHGLEGNAEW